MNFKDSTSVYLEGRTILTQNLGIQHRMTIFKYLKSGFLNKDFLDKYCVKERHEGNIFHVYDHKETSKAVKPKIYIF